MKKTVNTKLRTVLFVAGLMLFYAIFVGPAPVLTQVRDEFCLANDNSSLILTVSVVYPVISLFAILGGTLLQRFSLKRVYAATLLISGVSGALLFLFPGYWGLIASRIIFAVAFGISIPLFGTAVVTWYSPAAQESMDTVNGILPWAGALIAYLLASRLDMWLGSWRWATGFWCLMCLPLLLLWLISSRNDSSTAPTQTAGKSGIGEYLGLIRRREILACVLIYLFDFSFYAYFSAVYPMYIVEGAAVSESTANLLASLTFPLVGVVFSLAGGIAAARFGRRKPVVLWCQMIKFVGIILAAFINRSLILSILGVCIFTVGNAAYLPAMYMVPTDIKMSPAQTGMAFSLIMAIGQLVGGVLSSSLGGKLADHFTLTGFASMPATISTGLTMSILIFNALNLLAFLAALLILRETAGKTVDRTDNSL